jgi:serine/threonine-protein kinase
MALEKLGKYKITGKIGKGAMGEVYVAHDPVLNREVAIKTISASLSADNELRKRFHREAQAAARLNHPNIITVFDYGEEQGIIYMAMELLEGADLKDLIFHKHLASLEDKLDVMEQVADGLAFAHARDIIHRDLKPGNIHIQPNGQVKILDFGLARLGGGGDMTRTGVVMGTPNYMAPEQVRGEKADARADVFSVGAVYYEILASKKPFDADSAHAVLFQVVHQRPRSIRDWEPGVPPILVQLVEKAMHKDKEQRFKNGGELREALRLVRAALASGRSQTATLETEASLAPSPEKPKEVFRSSSRPGPGTPRPTSGPPSQPRSAPSLEAATRALPRAEMFTETRPSHPPTRPSSRLPLVLGGAFVALLAVVGAVVVLRAKPEPAPTPAAADAQVAALSETLVGAQVELARRDLEDKDFKSAIAQAERALKIAPENEEAQQILQRAQSQIVALEAAASEAQASLEQGDTQTATEALGRLLSLDPQHPAAVELSARLNRFFESQAHDAQAMAAESRSLADRAKASSSELYGQAVARSREADELLSRSEYAQAARAYLESSNSFLRARRAAEAQAPPAGARVASPAARPTPPPTSVPAATLPPATAPPPAEPPPSVPPRPFVATPTTVQAAARPDKAPAGFDSQDVLADRDFACKLDFEYAPAAVSPGDSYSVKVFMANEAAKPIKMKSISLTVTSNGDREPRPAQSVREAPARQRTLLGEFGGSWPEGVQNWSLEAVVTSSKDDSCRSRLTLR